MCDFILNYKRLINMFNGRFIIFWSLVVISSTCYSQVNSMNGTVSKKLSEHEFRYTNPITRDTAISMRDHNIIKVGKQWYCTGTSEPVWTGHNPGVRL